ncbi:hypothetical protein [Luteimonas terrae]|uniref:Uncharacterized protein n=1 Tax=Luteimonas terrae TaxID=1530191 RepID=A0ABU1XW79_9GAMM|nr:hypothetical protein [Luteimonas terrae]MDR7192381.1 hypothetical protein [Luteimonas terrae]
MRSPFAALLQPQDAPAAGRIVTTYTALRLRAFQSAFESRRCPMLRCVWGMRDCAGRVARLAEGACGCSVCRLPRACWPRLLLGSDVPRFILEQNLDALNGPPLTGDAKAKSREGNARMLLGLAD